MAIKAKTEADSPQEDVGILVEAEDTISAPPTNIIKKKDIYDHVTVSTGLRKREVREAVDATFAYLFDCLSQGKDVQCPPMGKIRSITKGEGDNVKMIYKVNLQKPRGDKKDMPEGEEPLAEAPE